MADYSEDYVVFDDFGIKEIHCMKCHTMVAMRDFTEVMGQKVLGLRQLSNWKQVRIELNNGTYAEPIFCIECVHNINPEKALEQIKRGWIIELRDQKKATVEEIKGHSKRHEILTIKGKEKPIKGQEKKEG